MQPETAFKKDVMKALDKLSGIYYFKVQQVSVRGIPDIIGCYRGRLFAWEIKVKKNKVGKRSLQAYNLKCIKLAGGISREVNPLNFKDAMEELCSIS